jgi:hypothetical protein
MGKIKVYITKLILILYTFLGVQSISAKIIHQIEDMYDEEDKHLFI